VDGTLSRGVSCAAELNLRRVYVSQLQPVIPVIARARIGECVVPIALGEDYPIRSVPRDTEGVISETRIDRGAVDRKRNGIRTACSAYPGIRVDGLEIPAAAIGKLELLDPPVGGLRVELIGSLDRLAGWVDADHEIAAHPADRQVARIQVREFERIDLGSGRGLTVDSIVPVRRCRGRRVPSFGKASFQILASKSISGVEGSSSAGTALQ
jgi:hypothetical protein